MTKTKPALEQKGIEKASRSYSLGKRETDIAATRERVLAAARALLLTKNALAGFSLAAVAKRSGVTRATVYQHFKSKRGLLEALFDQTGKRGQLDQRLPEVFSQPNSVDALRTYTEVFCDFWESDRVMNRRLRGYATLDKVFAEAIEARNERRRPAIDRLLKRLSKEGLVSSSVRLEDAVQTVMALTSFEFYDVLADERSPQEVSPFVVQLVLAALKVKL